ncbi:MAG: hypothetical protein IAG13_21445 [Deltaproteobacteria bacterium]|nr:hypothetical protein [Nannocystaceae bacterium]
MTMFSKHTYVTSALTASILGFSAAAIPACDPDDGPLGQIAEQCGLECSAKGFVGGDAKISGIASIDAFFGAAIDLNASMRGLSGGIRAELDAIGASVGLQPGASGAEIKAALQGYLDARVEGGLTVKYAAPKCEANIEASVSAAAECDVQVDPGEVTVKCEGSCKAEAGVEVDCGASADLKCTGTAPNLECEGTCSGSCVAELTAEASCEGTCRGSCTAEGGTQTGFDGKCNGMCMGECAVEASAGVMCEGKCEGSCEYTPPGAMCDANAEARCDAKADASVECSGGCEGKAEPPEVSAECEASVEAKASASIECSPPSLDIGFQFNASLQGDVNGQAEFRAWLEGFRARFSALLALRAKAEVVVDAATNLSAAAGGAVTGAVEELSADVNVAASFGAVCALAELPVAGEAIVEASGTLSAEITGSAEVISAVGG